MRNNEARISAEVAEEEFKSRMIMGTRLSCDLKKQKFSVARKGKGVKRHYFVLNLKEDGQELLVLVNQLQGSPAFNKVGSEYILDEAFLIEGKKGEEVSFTK